MLMYRIIEQLLIFKKKSFKKEKKNTRFVLLISNMFELKIEFKFILVVSNLIRVRSFKSKTLRTESLEVEVLLDFKNIVLSCSALN